MEEKRQNIRWQVNQEGSLNLLNNSLSVFCYLRDISIAGARIYLKERLADVNSLVMGLRITDDIYLENVKGNIIWENEEDGGGVYGIVFNGLDVINKNKVYDLVYKSISPDKKEPLWKNI